MKIALISTLTSIYRKDIWSEIGNVSEMFTLICSSKSFKGIKTFNPKSVEKIDYFIESKIRYYKNIPIYQNIPKLYRVLRENEIIILPGEVSLISTWRILLLSKLFKNKTIIWTHGLYGRESKIRKWLTILFYSLADTIWVYNSYAKKLLQTELKKKITVVYNSNTLISDNDSMKEDHKYDAILKKIHKDDKIILFFGRIDRKRNLSLLLNCFLKMSKELSNLKLLIIGNLEKDYEQDFLEMIRMKNNVIHVNGIYDIELLGKIFNRSHVMVYPEGVGLAGLHCMNHGLPVISHNDSTTQKPEFEAIKNISSKLLFEKNDMISMENVINYVLNMDSSNYSILRQECENEIKSRWNVNSQIGIIQKNLKNLINDNH